MSRRNLLFLPLLLSTLAVPLAADDHPNTERGFAAEKAFAVGEVDSVNVYNGNLVLTIPIGGTYPVGGALGYGLTLVFNSNTWDFQEREDMPSGQTYTQALPPEDGEHGPGLDADARPPAAARPAGGQILSFDPATGLFRVLTRK